MIETKLWGLLPGCLAGPMCDYSMLGVVLGHLGVSMGPCWVIVLSQKDLLGSRSTGSRKLTVSPFVPGYFVVRDIFGVSTPRDAIDTKWHWSLLYYCANMVSNVALLHWGGILIKNTIFNALTNKTCKMKSRDVRFGVFGAWSTGSRKINTSTNQTWTPNSGQGINHINQPSLNSKFGPRNKPHQPTKLELQIRAKE